MFDIGWPPREQCVGADRREGISEEQHAGFRDGCSECVMKSVERSGRWALSSVGNLSGTQVLRDEELDRVAEFGGEP
jgi:hypothetical protein